MYNSTPRIVASLLALSLLAGCSYRHTSIYAIIARQGHQVDPTVAVYGMKPPGDPELVSSQACANQWFAGPLRQPVTELAIDGLYQKTPRAQAFIGVETEVRRRSFVLGTRTCVSAVGTPVLQGIARPAVE